jgi:centromeric protein E
MESKINVTVRIKPLSESEKTFDKNHLWTLLGDNTLMNIRTKEMFSFDSVFGEKISTQEIFDSSVSELVETALSGINVTVFAYGQTSSGKTHTMRGY